MNPDLTARTGSGALGTASISPPSDRELWSYVAGDGRWFVRFSAASKICLGGALVFLALRGNWLMLLMPFALMLVAGGVIGLIWSSQVPPFDRLRHARLVEDAAPSAEAVDVFIMTCGEDPDIVGNTIAHAARLRHSAPVHLYVLDDRGCDEVRAHAEQWGANYLARPDRGWMKKAGNLHFGYECSSSPLILVLDADFAVREDFLEHTVPYFDDPRLGILQTPQFFRTSATNWVERGAAAQQEQFYRVGLRARDRHDGAICVGTNAVYRREALDARGGMALLEHSEDIFTGMKVMDAGYRVDYLPLPLAAGSTPSTTEALASQQYRWARGNFALAGAPLFKRMRLSRMQRLGLWDGWIFYVTSALSPIVALFVPIVTLAEAPHAISWEPAMMILPALFTEFVLQPRWLHLPDGRASRRVGLVSQVSHFYALRDHLADRDQEWIPTGGARAGGGRQSTDRIPGLIASTACWGFVVVIGLLVARVLSGWSLVDLAPVGVLAAVALPTGLGVATPPEVRPSTTPTLEADGDGRDAFLDVVRAMSIVRVMFWHALGFWWISWTFAAMPAVFYVSGAVFATSLRRRSAWQVVRARLRRLVPPYAAFVLIALGLIYVAEPRAVTDHVADTLSWLVPYRSPAPLMWEDGWLSTPLWFLRALVLVLLLTPIVLPIGRRLPAPVLAGGWFASLIVVDVAVARQTTEMATAVVRGVGDVVCFGGFFALGVTGHHLRYKLTRRVRLSLLGALVAVTAVATVIVRPVDMVVNNSYVLFGLVGLSWLMAVLSVEDHLRHIGSIPAIRSFVGWITKHAVTVYLWHTLALCLTYAVVGAPRTVADLAMLIGAFAIALVVTVTAVRPLEALGGGRRDRLRPAPALVVAGALALAVGQPSLFPVFTDAAAPPQPSGRPPIGGAADVGRGTAGDPAALGENAEAWLLGHGVAGAAVVEVGGPTDGRLEHVRLGDRAALDPDAAFETLSVTKTMVAAVALQLVDEGALTLDGRLPVIDGVEESATGQLTLRRLLSHATGIIDYREHPDYRDDMILTPVDAVNLALSQSDLGVTDVRYAAPNYLLVGLLIEQVTGEPLSEVLDTRLFEPLGLRDTELVDNTREGFVGHASGGVVSTVRDLALWYDALVRRRSVLSDDMFHELVWGGIAYAPSAGLGTWRHCPCDPPSVADSEPYLYLFHDGGDVRLVYIPSRDVVLVMRFSTPLYGDGRIVDDIDDFVFAVADRRPDGSAQQ